MGRQLSGMKEICDYYKRSEPTILSLIRDADFPATKAGGIWESDTELIDEWRRDRIRKSRGVPASAAQEDRPVKSSRARRKGARS